MRIGIYPRPYDKQTVYLKTLRWWDWDYEKIRRNLPAIQSGDLAALARAE